MDRHASDAHREELEEFVADRSYASLDGDVIVVDAAAAAKAALARIQSLRRQRQDATSGNLNALEGVDALHNDSLLCLDEIGLVDPRNLDASDYAAAGEGSDQSYSKLAQEIDAIMAGSSEQL